MDVVVTLLVLALAAYGAWPLVHRKRDAQSEVVRPSPAPRPGSTSGGAGSPRMFHRDWEPYTSDQVDPIALGRHLAARNEGQELVQVRVYRGQPDST